MKLLIYLFLSFAEVVMDDNSEDSEDNNGKCSQNPQTKSKITIKHVSRKDGNKLRFFDKRQCCFYCFKLHSKISKHYQVCHSTEEKVKEIMKHSPGELKNMLMEELRHLGNYNHNLKVLKKKSGNLIVVRRPTNKTGYDRYLPCVHCLGFFKRDELYSHTTSCKFNTTKDDSSRISESKLLVVAGSDDTDFMKMFITRARSDDINTIVRNDALLLSFGELLYDCHGEDRYNYITQRLREMGRLLKQAHSIFPDIKLINLLSPQNFYTVIRITKDMIYSEKILDSSRSFWLRVGHSIKRCCLIMKSRGIKTNDLNLKSQAEDFLKLYEEKWIKSIPSERISDDQPDNEQILSLTANLVKLSNYLDQNIKIILEENESELTESSWVLLSKLTLLKLIHFNKSQRCDVGEILLKDYLNRTHFDDEIHNTLSDFEKKLSNLNFLDFLKIQSKKGHLVPLIFTEDISRAMSLLSKNRQFVNENNEFFFANKGEFSLRHKEVLKEICMEANVQNIELFTSFTRRKYVAATFLILSLNTKELDILANHIGHDLQNNREFYRLESSTSELMKISESLLAVKSPKAHKFAGQTIFKMSTRLSDRSRTPIKVPTSSFNETTSPLSEAISLSPFNDGVARNKIKTKPKLWNPKIKEEALRYFSIDIKRKQAPGKAKCRAFINEFKVKGRKWKDVKNLIKNTYYKK